jgi:hypothetical protein
MKCLRKKSASDLYRDCRSPAGRPGATTREGTRLKKTGVPLARATFEERAAGAPALRRRPERQAIAIILRDGRKTVFIGMVFLIAVNAIAELLRDTFAGRFVSGLANGLEIFGWVALWQPAEMLLYEWVPVYRRLRMLQRLSETSVECQAT